MRLQRRGLQSWNAVGLAVADDGLLIEGVGVRVIEGCAGWDEGVGDGLTGGCADAEFDAGGVDALLLHEVLAGIEGTFSSRLRLLLGV